MARRAICANPDRARPDRRQELQAWKLLSAPGCTWWSAGLENIVPGTHARRWHRCGYAGAGFCPR